MPTLIIIDGVKIECFAADHPPPHIHASYAEFEDLIVIETGKIYVGNLPSKKRKLALAYVKENKERLVRIFNALNPPLNRN